MCSETVYTIVLCAPKVIVGSETHQCNPELVPASRLSQCLTATYLQGLALLLKAVSPIQNVSFKPHIPD